MARPTRSEYAAFHEIPTRWKDNDAYGHMNNSVHYSLFDTAINCWLTRNELLDVENARGMAMVAETGCKYHGEIMFPDLITVGLRVDKLGNSSLRYGLALFRNEDDVASASGFLVHVYVDPKDRRPTPINEKHRQAFAKLMRT